jgi:hypothetical protein
MQRFRPCSGIPGILLFACLVQLVTLLPTAVSPAEAGTYREDFTTTAFKDTVHTTADWDTLAGDLRLHPFVPGLVGTCDTPGYAQDVAVSGDLALVSDYDSGLQLVDISNPESPTLAGSIDTPGGTNGVVVDGELAFVADGGAGLQVIDISDPANPAPVGNYDTPGIALDVAVAGDLALVADGICGLQVIDISNPAGPILEGTYDTPGYASGVVVSGDLAFVADQDGGLQIIDISNPAAPALAGSYSDPDDVVAVAVAGPLALLAESGTGLEIVDITNPANPYPISTCFLTGSIDDVRVDGDLVCLSDYDGSLLVVDITNRVIPTLVGSCATSGPANGVATALDLAFVACGNAGLQVVKTTQLLSPTLVGSYDTPWLTWNAAVSGDFAVLAGDTLGVEVLDVSNPAAPTVLGSCATPGTAFDVAVAGHYAFVADEYSGLSVVDISDPGIPTVVGSCDTPDQAVGVAIAGALAFVADSDSGLLVFDISNPAYPTLVGSCDTPGLANRVAVSGDLAFVADHDQGLQIIDISNPASPTLIANYPATYLALFYDVAVAGNLVFVADYAGGLKVIDVSSPANPTLVGEYDTLGDAFGVAVSGDLAFVAAAETGLQVFDISNPASPTLFGTVDTWFAFSVVVSGEFVYVSDGGLGLRVIRMAQHEFDASRNIGRSLAVDSTGDTVARARLSSVQSAGATWELSANGGATFQAFPVGPWTRLTTPGSELQWRSTHVWTGPGVNPSVSELTIDWLSDSAPIASITDVPDDQGGWVRLGFTRSGYDFAEEDTLAVTGYGIYRRVDDAALAQQVESLPVLDREALRFRRHDNGIASFANADVRTDGDRVFVRGTAAASVAQMSTFPPGVWESVSYSPATQQDDYLALVPTVGDSGSTGVPYSVYMVTTHTTTPSIWFTSAPDSGYSLDNIAPGVPQGFAVAYGQATVDLSWDPAPESDFQYFRVYRSADPDFVPGPATLVHETDGTSWQDTPSDPGSVYYKLTAVDHAGNESGPASSGAVTAVGGGPGVPAAFALRAAVPNPMHGGTRIAFDLPHDSPVLLRVYDVGGRLLRTLVRGTMPAGRHDVTWDGVDERGRRAPAGVYLYRLRAGDFEAGRRLVLLR